MEISKHLDKINSMGFDITIDWNSEFGIYYLANDVFPASAYSALILRCSYYRSSIDYTFEQMMECCCDAFYAWYNANIDIIKEFDRNYDEASLEKLESCSLNDITKQVARDLNLTDILELFAKHEKTSD